MINSLFTIITFYQFKKISKPEKLQIKLKDFCKFNKIRGTIIIAKEGINSTVAGTPKAINLLEILLFKEGFDNLESKYSSYLSEEKEGGIRKNRDFLRKPYFYHLLQNHLKHQLGL